MSYTYQVEIEVARGVPGHPTPTDYLWDTLESERRLGQGILSFTIRDWRGRPVVNPEAQDHDEDGDPGRVQRGDG